VHVMSRETLGDQEERVGSILTLECALVCCHLVLTVLPPSMSIVRSTEDQYGLDLEELETNLTSVLDCLSTIQNGLQQYGCVVLSAV
jgi:hypothetical protein